MKTKVLFATSECVPFLKTGGLADVAGSLPKYFDKEKYDVRVIMPNYTCIPEKFSSQMKEIDHFYTGIRWKDEYVGLLTMELDGVTFYFIDNLRYFTGDQPYGYADQDIEKFAFFCKAVLSCIPKMDWRPDILHCHDWQTGLIPVYLNDSFQGDVFFHQMKTIFTIHNLKFQGLWGKKEMAEITCLSDYYFTPDKLELYGDGNMLKGGLVYADRITTVSDTYAKEIQTPFYGERLDGLLRAKNDKLIGIVNGIDTEFYNPSKDADISANYSRRNYLSGKKANKLALQKELGLPEREDVMMIGIVSRLTDQKGFDLIACVMEELCAKDIQLVVLGTGDKMYENMFKAYQEKYPDKVSASIFYSEALSHRIYAASDAFLMPSLFEPCGLSQLMSLRYGALPIVHETGGLKDTVEPYNEVTDEGTGFSFTNINAHDMLHVVEYAIDTYYQKRPNWNRMVVRAMAQDFSWNASARKYEKMYDDLMAEKEEAEKKFAEQDKKARKSAKKASQEGKE